MTSYSRRLRKLNAFGKFENLTLQSLYGKDVRNTIEKGGRKRTKRLVLQSKVIIKKTIISAQVLVAKETEYAVIHLLKCEKKDNNKF